MLTIAIIGAGPLGRWLALAAARVGHRVCLEDVMPSNLGRAREGDRVDLARSHFGNNSDHARIVDFRSVNIWKHWIRFRPGAFEELQKSLVRIAGI